MYVEACQFEAADDDVGEDDGLFALDRRLAALCREWGPLRRAPVHAGRA